MPQIYNEEFQKKIVRLHLQEGRKVSLMNSVFLKQVLGECILKKSGGILCKGNTVEIYHFISANKREFGLRWLLNLCNVYPNAYYRNLSRT